MIHLNLERLVPARWGFLEATPLADTSAQRKGSLSRGRPDGSRCWPGPHHLEGPTGLREFGAAIGSDRLGWLLRAGTWPERVPGPSLWPLSGASPTSSLGHALTKIGGKLHAVWSASLINRPVPGGSQSLRSPRTVRDGASAHGVAGDSDRGRNRPEYAVALPSNGAMVSGTIWVVASAQSAAGVVSVHFEVSGGLISDMTVATTGPTACCGWLGAWDTTDVPNGNYMLQSVVTDKAGNSATSPAVSVTVDNLPLHTQVLIPSAGATVGGNVFLDASAQGTAPVTGVTFTATQGSTVETVATATPTIYGWIAEWPSGVGPNNGSLAYDSGTWSIQSVATEVGGTTATSSPVQITLVTLEDLVSSSNFTLTSGGICGLSPLLSTYSGIYPGSTSVGTVSLAADPCSGFTLSTDVGSVSGPIAIAGMGDLYILQVTNGTGLFTGTTGEGLFLGIFPGPPATGDVSVA